MPINFDFWKNFRLNGTDGVNGNNNPAVTNPLIHSEDISIFLSNRANGMSDDLYSLTTDEFVPSTKNAENSEEAENTKKTDDNKEVKKEEKADKKYDKTPFFLSSDAKDIDFNALISQESELEKLISESTILSKDTLDKKKANAKNITELFDKLYTFQDKLDNLSDEDKEILSKLYEDLKSLLSEREEIEKQISEELQKNINSEDEKKAQEAKQLVDALKNITETRENFKMNSLTELTGSSAADAQNIFSANTPASGDAAFAQGLGDSSPVSGGSSIGDSGGSSGGGNSLQNSDVGGLENMSISQLKTEQSNKQTALDNAHNQINEVYSGKNTAVSAAKENYSAMKENYENLVEELEKQGTISKELKEKQADNLKNIENKEKDINNTKTEINNTDKAITDNRNSYTAAVSEKGALEAAIASYDNVNTEDGSESQEIANKKAEAEKKLETIKQTIAKLESEYKTLTDKKTGLESTLKQQETDLTTLETEKTQIEQEILKNCEQLPAEQKEKVTNALNEFNKARENVKTTEQEQLAIANKNVETAKSDLDKVNTVYNEKSKAETTGKYSYRNTLMEDIIRFGGSEYLSVMSKAELENLCATAKKNGWMNLAPGMGDRCLEAGYQMIAYAAKGQKNTFTDFNLDSYMNKVVEILDQGKPVLAKVDTKKGTRHFSLIVGIKKGATAPYKQSDFLCVDTYDANVDKMGRYTGGDRDFFSQPNKGGYWGFAYV